MKDAAGETQLRSPYQDSMQIPPAPVVFHLSLDLRDKMELCHLELLLAQAKSVGEVQVIGYSLPGPHNFMLA